MISWTPESWQSLPASQQPVYRDPQALRAAIEQLSRLPPLVTSWEVLALKQQLAEAAQGRRFLLQGGDCAERFADCASPSIASKLKILLQMSVVLIHGLRQPVIRVGRFAGQYAKPRSNDTETRNGVTLPSYRGDLINRPAFTAADREPDPRLLIEGYSHAALTLNFVRALVRGGFADLHHPEYWDLDFVQHSPLAAEFRRITDSIHDSLVFMENVLGTRPGELEWVDFFTSHEALHLDYEQAQTRQVPRRVGWYNLSCHFPWIGMRTADPGGAHVEYCRGIENPVAVKIGAGVTPDCLLRLASILDPANVPGRLTFIHRFGASKISRCLPPLIKAMQSEGRTPLWCADPMHGNTRPTSNGVKTRCFSDIVAELDQAFDLHQLLSSRLGGVHIELTGDNVTECTGGARGLTEADLETAYTSEVDPRLNGEQALEIAMLIARKAALAR